MQFFLVSHCPSSVEPIYQKISQFLDYNEFCTNEGMYAERNSESKTSLITEREILKPTKPLFREGFYFGLRRKLLRFCGFGQFFGQVFGL